MTDFKSKTYTNEQIEAIIAEYHESHKPITLFCKDRGHKPAYQTLKGWLDASGKGAEGKATTKAPAAKAAPTTLAGMEAAIKQQQEVLAQQKKDYVKLLRNEVTRLKAELGKATQKYEEITEGMSQAELEELHNSDAV